MSLLSHKELLELMEAGVVSYITAGSVNSSSIDLTLGNKIYFEQPKWKMGYGHVKPIISLRERNPLQVAEHDLSKKAFLLYPGHFILAHTKQMFYLPNDISGEYKLKSSMARIGLEHLNAGWCDAGWHGSVLTLELKNMTNSHVIKLEEGDPIGQMVFFKHSLVDPRDSYAARGRYNNDSTVKGIKA